MLNGLVHRCSLCMFVFFIDFVVLFLYIPVPLVNKDFIIIISYLCISYLEHAC